MIKSKSRVLVTYLWAAKYVIPDPILQDNFQLFPYKVYFQSQWGAESFILRIGVLQP